MVTWSADVLLEAEFEIRSQEAEKAMQELSEKERAKKVEKLKKTKTKYVKYSETVKNNIVKSFLGWIELLSIAMSINKEIIDFT